MAINITPTETADKLIRRLSAAGEDMRKGVEAVTESPTKKAAARADKMRQNILAAIDNGDWAKGLNAVSTEDWKRSMTEKGIARVPQGIQNARAKLEAFYAKLLPYQSALKDKVDKMSDLTLQDNINRMVTFVQGMAGFKK
jgi:hypothetical protein